MSNGSIATVGVSRDYPRTGVESNYLGGPDAQRLLRRPSMEIAVSFRERVHDARANLRDKAIETAFRHPVVANASQLISGATTFLTTGDVSGLGSIQLLPHRTPKEVVTDTAFAHPAATNAVNTGIWVASQIVPGAGGGPVPVKLPTDKDRPAEHVNGEEWNVAGGC